MESTTPSEHVQVLEPDPNESAVTMAIFEQLVGKWTRGPANILVLVLFGGLVCGGLSLTMGTVPVLLVVWLGLCVVGQVIRSLRYAGLAAYSRSRFTGLTLGPEDALAAKSRVSLRHTDGDTAGWLVTRLPRAERLQLAGQRRIWVLGPGTDGRAFVMLPGTLRPRRARLRSRPVDGSAALTPVSREPSPPHRDPVLRAHADRVGVALVWNAVFLLAFAGALSWSVLRSSAVEVLGPRVAVVPLCFAGLIVLGACWYLVLAVRLATWRPAEWTELRIVLDKPVQVVNGAVARLAGRAVLPGGWTVGFRMRADPSLAATIGETGRLWVIGEPSGSTRVGVPGYPLVGIARFSG
ncbi:hypothetical protein [Amycolatopsis samaneae]|uniref:DUF304 domain-containing protein n=1 Tax=Amycolatopsis samaneae TaxID=664691 RepID=A0ABW5GFZ7_9PSEU